jgi:RNA polymerase sporulation-specific sigma factor
MAYDKGRVEYLLGQSKTEDVIEELLILNFGLINKQLYKFYMTTDPEALSLAYEALYNAILTYDSTKNSKFSTYATVCIYNRLGSYVRSLNTASNLDLVSYDKMISEDGLTLLDVLVSSNTADGTVLSDCGVDMILKCIMDCISVLQNPLHKKIVETWVKSEFKMTHERIAAELNCTQSYVSQVIKTFKNNLKKKLEEKQ